MLPIFLYTKKYFYMGGFHTYKHKLLIHLAYDYMCILKRKATLNWHTIQAFILYICDLPFFSLSNFYSRLIVWGHMKFSSLFVSYTELSFGSKRKQSTKSKRNRLIVSWIKILKAWRGTADFYFFLRSNLSLLITRLV